MNSNQDLSLKLFVVLSKAYKVTMERAVKDMKKHGLSETEFTVLELLYHKGKYSIQRIGEKILVTSGGMTYTIDKLEKKGYLRRVACPEDRRVTYAEMTDEGAELLRNIFPSHAQVIESLMQGLSVEEKEQAIALIKKIGIGAQAIKID
ncbi:MarR family transcriptional regulator [Paenibacillus glycanilyticus]|uniref:MarR family winged helix-turn-helix transcriptional regulator n=1 Tax=Paenibacillus glycanilyticus TaxID=126569 RepID=UPI00203ACED1|nr:MarR family transcriptional regulator [Paenibacillus glycanilyticus]MCM3629873.1 MarR family transcriptional regulator [Paenibacillus glycanilyticus]